MDIHNNITKFLIRNSIVTYGMCLITIGCLVVTFMTMRAGIGESRNYLYMVRENGDIVPMEWVKRRDNIEIEIKHHLQMLVDNFYHLNQFNWEEKTINRAFWLGDLEKIHKDRENRGYYNRYIQYNVEQTAELSGEDIELKRIDNEEWEFRIIINLEEKYLNNSTPYVVFTRGKIKVTDRNFPYNPHGLWVYNYVEDRIVKLENE